MRIAEKPVNRGRHESACQVCRHPERETIEREWIDWGNTVAIATEYGLTRKSIYCHAHALNLFSKRGRNIRKALERIIDKADHVDVTAAAVVAAIQAYAKINAQGQWVDRSESLNLNDLFDRMTREELEKYAREGTLPDWFNQAVTVTPSRSGESGNDREI